MSVEDNGRLVVFENRVRVNIDPAALKAAGVNGGEQNASQ
jgi:lipopolysaccharide export system protein LptC